jgi:predicted Zn-dependent protease
MKYSRADESEADWLGVCFMNDSGYDTQDMVKVMQIIESLSQGQQPPEFLSSHPDPGNRILQIQDDIQSIDQCP